jgi:glycosyltransferase involved in cell wall biosynthesis
MNRLAVAVICCNEEAILDKSLSSVQWADEIVVVDSFSTDRTLQIARRYTDKVVQHAWLGYGRQKNLALGLVSCPWVLSLDADEVVTPELGAEIRALLAGAPDRAGYRIPRKTVYLGRLLNHAWYPDRKLRLFRKEQVTWGEEKVHESIHLNGSSGNLSAPLVHHSFDSIRDHLRTLQRYTTLGAEDLVRSGRSFSLFRLLGSPLLLFAKQFFWKRGFLDGIPGLIACVLSGVHEFVKYAKLYELKRTGSR